MISRVAGERALEERMGFLRRWRARVARWTHWRDDRPDASPFVNARLLRFFFHIGEIFVFNVGGHR